MHLLLASELLYAAISSDKIGRKIVLLAGLLVAVIGCVISIFSQSINMFIIDSLLQGLGFSSSSITRAILRDSIHDVKNMAKLSSIIGVFYAIAVSFAPIIGGYIERYAFWRLNFILIMIYAIIVIAVCYFKLEETNNNNRLEAKFSKILHVYYHIISNRNFIIYSLITSLALGGVIAYITISAYLFKVVIAMSPEIFDYSSIFTCAALAIGSFCNSKMVTKYGADKMLQIGAILFIISGLILRAGELINVGLILIPVAIFFFATGFVYANGSAGAISMFKDRAGIAGSVYSSFQMIDGALGSFLVSTIKFNNQLPLGMIYIVFGILAILAIISLSQKTS